MVQASAVADLQRSRRRESSWRRSRRSGDNPDCCNRPTLCFDRGSACSPAAPAYREVAGSGSSRACAHDPADLAGREAATACGLGVENRRYVPLGATAKFRAAAVHGIMAMTRGKGRYALTASVYANVYVKIWPLFGAGLSEELTMTKSILAITILALTTSGALAAHH